MDHNETTSEIEVGTLNGAAPDELASAESRSARLALYGGIVLLALGWLVLYMGYNGAATHPNIVEQMPYVISGGFAGATLILLGGIMVLVHVILRARAATHEDIGELRDALVDLSDAISRVSPGGEGLATSNGFVVALRGGASFHRPDCHLVSDRSSVRRFQPSEASERGLSPCRVCKP